MNLRKDYIRKRNKVLVFMIAFIMVFSSFGGLITPHGVGLNKVNAANPGITLSTVADDNGTVNLTSAGEPVAFSYGAGNATTSKEYAARFDFQLPATATNIKITATLKEGLRYVNDASSGATVPAGVNAADIVKTPNTAPTGYTGGSYTNTGKREYSVATGTTGTTVNLTLALDEKFHMSEINDALTVEVSYEVGGTPATDTVKISKVTATGLPTMKWYANGPLNFYLGEGGEYSNATAGFPAYVLSFNSTSGSSNAVSQLTEKLTMEVTFDNPDVELSSTDASWVCTETSEGVWSVTVPINALWYSVNNPLVTTMPTGLATGTTIVGTYKVTNHYYGGETSSTAVKTVNFKIAPAGEDVFVQYNSVAVASNPAGKPQNGTFTSAANADFASDTTQGRLAGLYVGNRGASDSGEKECEIHFDPDVTGVTGVRIPLMTGKTITSVQYMKEGDTSWSTATVNLTGDGNSNAGLTRNMLGLNDSEYILALKYDIGVVPKTYCTGDGMVVGTIKQANTPFEYTIEVRDKVGALTTGLGKAVQTTNVQKSKYGSYGDISPSVEILAGGKNNFSVMCRSYGGMFSTSHNIVYLRSESGIPFSNVKVSSDAGGDFTSQCTITTETIGGIPVTKIDMTNADGLASQMGFYAGASSLAINNVKITWELQTAADTPSGTYNFSDMIFTDVVESSDQFDTNATKGNPYSLPLSANGTMIYPATGNTYSIKGRGDMTVSTEAKNVRSEDSAYAVPNAANPILMSNSPSSGADFMVTLKNNSANALNEESVVYYPIPKVGDNWGTLLGDNPATTGDAFTFNMQLKGAVTDVDGSGFTVLYGVGVTPSDNGDTLAADTHFYTPTELTAAGKTYADVNCVKIVTTGGMTGGQEANFKMSMNVADTSVNDGLINTWMPLYYQNVTIATGLATGYTKGSPISAQTAMGELQGEIFLDEGTTLDGIKGATETNLADKANWVVNVYKQDGTLLQSVKTDANGQYHIYDLSQSTEGIYYLTVTNLDGTKYMFTVNKDQTATNVANVFMGQGNDHATAKSVPQVNTYTYDVLDATHGTYNIGVANKATTKITFKSSNGSTYGTLTLDTQTNKTTIEQEGLHTVAITVPTPAAKAGYKFVRWAETENGATAVTAANMGASGKLGFEAKTYWAVWEAKTYTVNYNLNYTGATNPASKTDQLFNDNITLPTNPTREGYTFQGWKVGTTDVTATTKYSALVSGDTVMSVTLIAQWRANATLTGTPLQISKTLTGSDPTTAQTFTFTITPVGTAPAPANNTSLQITTGAGTDTANHAYGLAVGSSVNISFGDVVFSQPGNYEYTVRETQLADSYLDCDDSVYTVSVSVAANNDNTALSVTSTVYSRTSVKDGVTTPETTTKMAFTNDYTPNDANPYPVAAVNKTVNGPVPTGVTQTFNYEIAPESTTAEGLTKATMPLPQKAGADNTSASTLGAGSASFGEITFTKAGKYVYTIKEIVAAPVKGYTFDPCIYTLTATVTDDGGTLKVTALYTAERSQVSGADGKVILPEIPAGRVVTAIEFINTYKPLATDPLLMVDPPVSKIISGKKPLIASAFTFSLTASSTTATGLTPKTMPMPQGGTDGTKNITIYGEGKEDFGTWAYTQSGTYVYTVSEVNSGISGFAYDTTVYTITDVVTDNSGQLELKRTIIGSTNGTVGVHNPSEYTFVNTYTHAPKTGDSGSFLYYMILMALAFVGLTTTAVLYNRSKKKSRHAAK